MRPPAVEWQGLVRRLNASSARVLCKVRLEKSMANLRRPGIPSVDPNMPHGLVSLLQPMKENIEIANGVRTSGQQVGSGVGYDGWSRRSFTLGMAVRLGLITEAQALAIWQDP